MENVQEKKENTNEALSTDEMSVESPAPSVEETTNASEILDNEEKEMPMEQSEEAPVPMSVETPSPKTPLKTYIRTKKCPSGCIKKTRCKGQIKGGKRSKKSKKSKKNTSKKSKKAKKSKK
jgi:hypothetical protein